MNITFTYRSVEKSSSLEAYAHDKLGSTVEDFHRSPIKSELTIYEEKLEKVIHLHLVSEHGEVIELTHRCDSFTHCIDKIHASLKRSLREMKEKRVSKQLKTYKKINHEPLEKEV